MKPCEWLLIRHFGHIYDSNFYRKPVTSYGHHEAKYTAAKLIFGQRYEDAALLDDGIRKFANYAATRHFQRDVGVRRTALVLALGTGFYMCLAADSRYGNRMS